MPVGASVLITHCLHYISSLHPRSILDVGCGFGLWGFLCPEYLDVMEERVQPDTHIRRAFSLAPDRRNCIVCLAYIYLAAVEYEEAVSLMANAVRKIKAFTTAT